MTLLELQTEQANKLKEVATAANPFWTTAWRLKSLNDGQNQFVLLTHCLEGKTVEFDTVADQVEYDLDLALNVPLQDFLCVSQDGKVIYQKDTTNHIPITIHDVDWLDQHSDGWRTADSGDPEYAYLRQGHYLGLIPAPEDTIVDGVKLYYTPRPIALANPTDVPLNGIVSLTDYHEALTDYSAWQGHELRDNFDRAEIYKGRFYDKVKLYNMKHNKSSSEVPDRTTKAIRVKVSRSRY